MPSHTVSRCSGHLNDLRRAGLVVEHKVGKMVYHALDAESPFAVWLREALALVQGDAQVRQDAAVIEKVQAIPIPMLTSGDLTLEAIRRRRGRRQATPTSLQA